MPPLLSRLPTTDPNSGDLLAVIETPKGSPNKYRLRRHVRGFQAGPSYAEGQLFPL